MIRPELLPARSELLATRADLLTDTQHDSLARLQDEVDAVAFEDLLGLWLVVGILRSDD